MPLDLAAAPDAYRRDGVVLLPGALDGRAMADALAAYDWSLAHPGPGATRFAQATDSTFYNDLYNPRCLEGYRADARGLAAPGDRRRALGHARRLVHVRAGVPEGGRRDAAHALAPGQLLPGHRRRGPGGGVDHASTPSRPSDRWSSCAARTGACSTTARASSWATTPRRSIRRRRCPACPTSRPTAPTGTSSPGPVEPGDLIVFHPATLHGGAPTHPGQRRRTLTLRFFGTDAIYDERPGRVGPRVDGFHQRMRQGDPFRDPSFLRLTP